MSELDLTLNHLKTISLPPVAIDVFYSDLASESPLDMEKICGLMTECLPLFFNCLQEESISDILGLKFENQIWEMDFNLIGNSEIQQMNQQYRGKDSATDVLSFPLLNTGETLEQLPVVPLGSVFVSVEWALTQTSGSDEPVEHYILERFIHGFLHILGQNHDDMENYERVVGIQKRVLEGLNS